MRKACLAIVISVVASLSLCVPYLAYADDANISEEQLQDALYESSDEVRDSHVIDEAPDCARADAIEDDVLAGTNAVDEGVALSRNDAGENTAEIDAVCEEQPGDEGADQDETLGSNIESDNNAPGGEGSPDAGFVAEGSLSLSANDAAAQVKAEVEAMPSKASQTAANTVGSSATTARAKQVSPKLKSGWYTVKSLINPSYALYVKGMKTKDGTRIQLKKGVTTAGYAFKFKKVGNYYRIIVGIAKGKSIQVLGVKNGSGGIVSITSKANKKTLFKVKYDAVLGGYRIINRATKQALAVKGGKAKNGAKVHGAKQKAGSKSQVFSLASRPGLITTNIYSIKSIQKGKRALSLNGTRGSFQDYRKAMMQKWYIAAVNGKKNTYIIESIATGKRLTGVADKRVKVKKAKDSDKAQWWVPSFGGKGIIWKNVATKRPLSTEGSKCDEGSKALNKRTKYESSNQFKLTKRIPLESGVYELKLSGNTAVEMGIEGSSRNENAAVRATETQGTASQKWIYNASTHTLENVFSGFLLDSAGTDIGTTLVQAKPNNSATQKWSFRYVGGGNFQLIPDANKTAAVSTTAASAGANVVNAENKQNKTQKWRIAQSGYLVEPKGFNLIEDFVKNGHGPLNATYIVIHETANPGATAWNHRMLWSGNNYYSDYAVHYVLDWTGNCYYCVPEDRLCWQVGNGNKYVIGIELCHATNKSDFMKVWNAGVQWAAWQLKKHGWGISRLISHNECQYKWGGTDHTDPDDYFESFGKSWKEFKVAVKQALATY